MSQAKQNKNTGLFIGFMILAAAANVMSRLFGPVPDSLMTALNYVILTGLLLFWIRSVRERLLPSAAKSSVLCAALLLLLYMLMRIFRYRFAVEPFVMRHVIYAYWIPQMLVPALFLMTCIRIGRGERKEQKQWEDLLLIPASALAAVVLTNDLHRLVYNPKMDLSGFAVDSGTYTYGPLFYLLYVWMIFTFTTGLVFLIREAGHMPKRALRDLLLIIALWTGALLFLILYMQRYTVYRPFNSPEVQTFGLLGIFEVCIRHRLIPYNENYSGFFRTLKLPVLITDRQLQPAYSTNTGLTAGKEELKAALTSPVALEGDYVLHGKEIRAGYAFWAENESGIRRAQEKLQEANETIEQENDLIRAETEQKEKEAVLQARHRIYHEIAEELYPVQKQISELLDSAEPGTDGFREKIAKVSVLNAYVKRKTNLLLLASENDRLSIGELALALKESAYYLTLLGLQTTARIPENGTLPADRITALYDAFESLAQQLTGKAPSLMVSWNGRGLRLAAETDQVPGTEGILLPVHFRKDETILYMDIASEPVRPAAEPKEVAL